MSLPPPNSSVSERRSRRTEEHSQQLVRALRAEGAQDQHVLYQLVGAPYWRSGQFDKALRAAVTDGRIHRTDNGRLSAR